MLLGAIAHWETSLYGVELVSGLDLRRGQRHRCVMTNAVEGDLLNAGQNVMETSIDKGAAGIDVVNSHVRCKFERLQLRRQG